MGLFDSRVVSVTPTGGSSGNSPAINTKGTSDLLKQLLASLSGQGDAANKAGEAQYADLLKSVGGTKTAVGGNYADALGLLSGAGTTALADINTNLAQTNARTEQDAISRGIGNTTIRSNLLAGNEAQAQRNRNSVTENVAAQKAGILQNQAGSNLSLGNLEADSILSKRIQAPDQSAYLSLLSQLGQSLGQSGGSVPSNLISGLGGGGGSSGGGRSGGSMSGLNSPSQSAGGGVSGGGAGTYYAGPGANQPPSAAPMPKMTSVDSAGAAAGGGSTPVWVRHYMYGRKLISPDLLPKYQAQGFSPEQK